MVPDPLFYQLLLVGLVWLCLMLHVVWPYDRATAGPTTPRPAKAPPKRPSDLKPFPGLTRTPPCAACEQAHEHGPQPPGCPPPRIVPTRGRPRQVDTSSHCCPHPHCAALIMASATPALSVRGQSPSTPEGRGIRGLRCHAECPKVANTVIEAHCAY